MSLIASHKFHIPHCTTQESLGLGILCSGAGGHFRFLTAGRPGGAGVGGGAEEEEGGKRGADAHQRGGDGEWQ